MTLCKPKQLPLVLSLSLLMVFLRFLYELIPTLLLSTLLSLNRCTHPPLTVATCQTNGENRHPRYLIHSSSLLFFSPELRRILCKCLHFLWAFSWQQMVAGSTLDKLQSSSYWQILISSWPESWLFHIPERSSSCGRPCDIWLEEIETAAYIWRDKWGWGGGYSMFKCAPLCNSLYCFEQSNYCNLPPKRWMQESCFCSNNRIAQLEM